MNIRRAGLLGVSCLFLVSCAGSKSRLKVGNTVEGEVVEAEGLAPHEPSDMIKTKRASLADAQRNAVEKAVGVYVSGRTMVEKAVAIENNILARTDGYIKKYDILSEGPSDNGLYKTRIRALVAIKELEQDLKDLALLRTPELKRPRIGLEIKEEIDKALLEENAAATALQRSLIEQGFVVVEGSRIKEAELLIKGKASAHPFQSAGLGGFVSYRARLTVQVVRPDTKDVVSSYTKEASGLGGNNELAGLKALETVGQVAGTDLGQELSQVADRNKNLLVYVEGVASFADVDKIRKALSAQAEVKDLMLRMYDEQMAQFELELAAGARPLELAAKIEANTGYPLKILEATAQSLRLAVK